MVENQTVKERLVRFLKYKNLSQNRFEKMCNLSNGYVNSMRKGISLAKLQNILAEFPELNRDWLMYGEGAMLREKTSHTVINVGDIIDGDSNMVHSTGCVADNGEIAILKAENLHLKEMISAKDTQLADKERLINILLDKEKSNK